MPLDSDSVARHGASFFSSRDESLVIYYDTVVIREGKTALAIAVARTAGVVFGRALPMYGQYRLTLVYLNEEGRRELADVVLPYRQVAEAIGALETLVQGNGGELVVKQEPYPLVPALAVLGLLVVPGVAALLRSGNVGVSIAMLFIASVLAAIELFVELRRSPKPKVRGQ